MKTNQEQNPLSVQVGDVVELKPLEECDDTDDITLPYDTKYFGGTYEVERIHPSMPNEFTLVGCHSWWFSLDWIARIVSRAGEQREAEQQTCVRCNESFSCLDGPCKCGECDPGEQPPEKPEAEQAGPVTEVRVTKNFEDFESIRQYNPATHRLIPVSEYVGPEEFAEMQRKAAEYADVAEKAECYDSVQDVCRATSHIIGIVFEDGSVMNFIKNIRDKMTAPLTATPGPPDLDDKPDDFYFVFCFSAPSVGRVSEVATCTKAEILEKIPKLGYAIEWHWHIPLGPIMPPGERKDGAE